MRCFCLLFLAMLAASCEDCKECFLIEETAGVKEESAVGKRCDHEIDLLTSQDLVCLDDRCYYECR